MSFFRFKILIVLILLFPSMPVSAGTLAVFPLLDLTQDANGVNFTLTEMVRQKAAEFGFEVLPDNEVMSFMVRRRIRNLGVLSSYDITNLKKDLAVDYALLGTVCQLSREPTAMVSISLKLIRTSDEEIVWSTIKDLHQADLISLLAISNPESLNDIYKEYFSTLLTTIPADSVSESDDEEEIGLLSVNINPVTVKPSERIELASRFYSSTRKESMPKISLQVGDRVIPVQMDEDSYYLEASWQAQEQPGEYSINMVAEFASGRKQQLNLGEYLVDGTPPEVEVNLLGTDIDGRVYFNKDLLIASRLKVPELLSNWLISVFDSDGENMLDFAGTGKLPDQIFWNGTFSGDTKAPDGEYRIRVTVWDQAGNSSEDEKTAVLRDTRPDISIEVAKKKEGVSLVIDNETKYPNRYWWLKVYEQNGGLVTMEVGEKFPATIDVAYDFEKNPDKLELIVAAQDVYGNRNFRRVRDIFQLDAGEIEVEYVQEKDWLENF